VALATAKADELGADGCADSAGVKIHYVTLGASRCIEVGDQPIGALVDGEPIRVTVHGTDKVCEKNQISKESRKAGENGQRNSCLPAFLRVSAVADSVRPVNGYTGS
jgi:hypothetical protein